HEPVVFRVCPARAGFGFLTTEPRLPRGPPTGAVADSAREADVFGPGPVGPIDLDRGGAAERAGIVGELRLRPHRIVGRVFLLVVVDQANMVVRSREAGHAVLGSGHNAGVTGQALTRPGHDPIAEPARQIEYPRRVRYQRPETGGTFRRRGRGRTAREHAGAAQQRKTDSSAR